MKPVVIEEEAELELAASVQFYEERREGLGMEFATEVRETVGVIRRNPEHFSFHKSGTRRFVMRRFPFVIHFFETAESIWIVAFAHTSRRPNYWRSRLGDD